MVALNAPTPAQPNGWGVVPAELICDPKIKDGAIRLYAFLATRCYNAGKDDRNVLTRKEIATYLEISESTVTNRVRELVERDWILVWEVGRSNAYMTYKTTKECREAREANPERAYVIFDKLPDLRVTRVNVDRGNQLPLSKRAKKVKTDVKLVQPVTQTGVTSSLNTDNQLPHSKHVSLIQNKKEINTDVSNDTSPADAGQGDPTSQNYDMVSDHIDGNDEMVGEPPEPFTSWDQVEQYDKTTAEIDKQQREYWKDKEVGEIFPVTHEDPPSVPDVSPTLRTVNKSGATVIRPRDPIFDSVARLQFGIDNTTNLPRGFGARVQRIVAVIVDAYKQRNNVTALSPDERLGLAGIHAKFWQWYTTVKYPARGNQTPKELKSDVKFAEYWLEYRAYKSTQQAKPDYSGAAEWRYQDDPTD